MPKPRLRSREAASRPAWRGFTLIELMIVIAIIAILVAAAVPVYSTFVDKARRTDGKDALQNTAQRLERCYTQYGAYDDTANCGIAADLNDGGSFDSPEGHYSISASTLTSTAFTLEASPQDAQSADDCGKLTLDQTGATTDEGSGDCW